MAAPQQHALTNTSCTFPASPAVFSTSGSNGGGQPGSCGDLRDRLSGISNCDIQNVVYSSAAVVSQPILAHTASRKTKPCSLCGTAAQRSQSSVVPISPISPQEQPVVLLHRLEDGLPEGDVDSLRAFGTIRLLPVHRHCGKAEVVADDSKHECDRNYQSVQSHSMSPGNLLYKSIKRENVKNLTELTAEIHNYSDGSDSLTKEVKRNCTDGDNYYAHKDNPGEKTEIKSQSVTSIVKPETDKGAISYRSTTKVENVYENSAGGNLNPGQEAISAYAKAAPHHSPVSPLSQSSHRLSSAQHRKPSSSLAESLNRSATARSPTSSNDSTPKASRLSTTAIHSHTLTSLPPCGIHDTIPRCSSPSTPMSVVCSPVVQLPSTTLSASPSQNISSPSAISPPESPPSPPTAFSPPLMGSPVTSDRETVHATCSVDVQPSSPYSPCTLPSLPASPTSLPSNSDSPPSPAPSVESPPVSPVASSDYRSEISHNQGPCPCAECRGKDSSSSISTCGAESAIILQPVVKDERRQVRDHKVMSQYQVSPIEKAEVPADKSSSDQHLVIQAAAASCLVRVPSCDTHAPDVCTATQKSATKTQVDSFSETSSVCTSEDKKENVVEGEQLNADLAECLLNSESVSADIEKSCSDYKSSLMKLVLKVKHSGSQQPQLGSEKKECNKESGIPKIVLTLTGKGPNKEYSCSNRIRNDDENCYENFNSKKHKSKRNKRQKPKDREKIKRIVKGDKHKRHLELFGEDSNDSCDINADSSSEHPSERRLSRTPSLDEQEVRHSTEPLSPGESFLVHSERDIPPSVPDSESSSGSVKIEENSKNKEPSVSPANESLSLSVSQVESGNLEINGPVEDDVKDVPFTEENKETPESQAESIENNTEESVRKTDEASPEAHATEPLYSDSEDTEEKLETSGSMSLYIGSNHPPKQPDGLILRSRKSRHAKNTESGRNSDACVWVSFGVSAPVPLPAVDVPSLKRIFTSKERTKLKEIVSAESKESFSTDESSSSVTEKLISKTSHKDYKEKEKTEAISEATKAPRERSVQEETKLSPTGYDHKHEFSFSCSKDQSSCSHGGSSHVRSRVRSKDDLVHHRHRHSSKRLRKSEESRERMVKKEVTACHQNSWKPPNKDDIESQEVSNNSQKGESLAFDAQLQSAENIVTNTPPTDHSITSTTDDCLRAVHEPTDSLPQSLDCVTYKEVGNVDKHRNIKTEENPDNQYYRPRKIRKICHSSTTRDQWNEKKSLEPTEDEKTQESKTNNSTPVSFKSSDSHKSADTVIIPLEAHSREPEASTAESDTSTIETGAYWKPHEAMPNTEKQPKSPRDTETVHEPRKCKYRSPTPQRQEPVAMMEGETEEQTHHSVAEEKEGLAGKQDDTVKDSVPDNEENEKQETEKKEKEKRRKSRREKRRDYSGTGGRCSILQEVQHRREVEHEEERGRRLAQEIKGFNWLEQKIKNGSLLSSTSAPSTPTTSPATKEAEPASKIQSMPVTTPSSQLTIANREEGLAKKKSLVGSSGGIGLKGHLQTAVPPLIPSSKVTALPKRRQSLGPSTTPPCSTTSTLSSVTSVPSMTVQGALYTRDPTPNRSEHGRVGPTLEKSSIGYEHEHMGNDRATLYSSTTSSKATLYGVKDNNFQAFYDTVSARSGNYYGSINSGSVDGQYNTSPAISFYGSTKYQESNPHAEKFTSAGSTCNSSVISSSSCSSTLKDNQQDLHHSPTSYAYPSKDSDWPAKQDISLKNSSKSPGSSASSHCSQRFSHKQALLRRAFQEMLKSEPNSSSVEQPKESKILPESEMKKADVSKCKETEAVGITSTQSYCRSTSPADNIVTNFESKSPDSAPPYSANISSATTNSSGFLHSQESATASEKSDKELVGSVHDEGKILILDTEKEKIIENVTYKLDPNDSDQTKKSENDSDVKEENENNYETSVKTISDSENKLTEDTKDLQTNIIDSIVSASSVMNVKVLKDEIIPKTDDRSNENPEVQPTLLLSVLYKELLKTRQEVEKLRKVQELMLTEKGEKKEDISEQSTDNKAESDTADENANKNERISEKRKEKDESHDTELKIDDDEFHHDNKRSKISIRNDLLSEEDGIAVDSTSSDTSTSQKNIPQPQQASSPTLASPTVIQCNSEVPVITLESSAIPEANHLSRVSPVITVASPVLSNSISVPPKITSSSPRGHARTSPGMSSPGVSRTSPGAPGTSPATPRASPGMPLSSMANSGIPISPGLSGSPGLQKSSPGIPRSSPGVLRMSPVLARASSGILRASPGTPVISHGTSGIGSIRNGAEVISLSPGVSQMIPATTLSNVFNSPTNQSTANTQISHSYSAAAIVQPQVTTVQSTNSPVAPIPGFPQSPATSNSVSIISSPGVRGSPHLSKIDTSKTDTSLTNMSPTKLRSVFGISSSEVELMPIPAGGAKYSLSDPQTQTLLKANDDNHHQISEAPLLMNAVRGIHRESSSKEVESSASRGSMPFHSLPCIEDPRRTLKTHQYESGVKRNAFSTSDLLDHPASVCKQPPPLKPVSSLLRRHSDNLDIHSIMHHQATYPGTHKNVTNSLHPSTSTTEHKSANSVHPFNQTPCTPSQYTMSGPSRRRNSDSNFSERSQEYQQSVSMGMQHPYPHLAPGASVMRCLGPDKASIFPIPPAMPPGIRPFKPTTPPSVSRAQREHYQNENFYRSNFSFFERLREKVAHSGDSGVNPRDRLQSTAANIEKPIQPQTFAPRVLVRESVPEASSHIATTTFSTLHFPNPNQQMPNVMANHQNHFSGNIHPGSSIHHMTQARLHPNLNQAIPNIQRNTTGNGGEKLCFRCTQPARFICSGCKKASYCSEHCQREDWTSHGGACVL